MARGFGCKDIYARNRLLPIWVRWSLLAKIEGNSRVKCWWKLTQFWKPIHCEMFKNYNPSLERRWMKTLIYREESGRRQQNTRWCQPNIYPGNFEYVSYRWIALVRHLWWNLRVRLIWQLVTHFACFFMFSPFCGIRVLVHWKWIT